VGRNRDDTERVQRGLARVALTLVSTVILSIFEHGLTAHPLARAGTASVNTTAGPGREYADDRQTPRFRII